MSAVTAGTEATRQAEQMSENGVVQSTGEQPELEEWKECRATIARFDNLLVDLRKYGFTLITGLLTASSFWFYNSGQKPETPLTTEAGVTLVLSVLIVALFVVDRSYEVLLHAVVARGIELETGLHFALTKELSRFAQLAKADTWASLTYALFIAAAQIPWLLSWLKPRDSILRTVLILGVIGLVWFVRWYHDKSKKGGGTARG